MGSGKDDATEPVVRCELDSTEQVVSTVAGWPGAIGYSELNLATGYKGLHQLLDGHTASVEDLEHGTSSYPYREIEYACTYGRPPTPSPPASSPTSAAATARTSSASTATYRAVPGWA